MAMHTRLVVLKRAETSFRLSACVLALGALLTACGGGTEGEGTAQAPRDTAQLVYKNGDVLTLDKANSVAQAVGVRDGKIIVVGTEKEVDSFIGSDTKVVDLGGKTLIPGFYDAHSHFVYTGTNAKYETDLNSPPIGAVQSIDDVVRLLQDKQKDLGDGVWITGFGYDDTLIKEKRHPSREDLDKVSTTQPVYITHISGHMSVANSYALQMAGVTKDTADPEGGMIGRDPVTGEPTGYLAENAMQLVSSLKPGLTADQVQEGIKAASQLYVAKGVTTANDSASGASSVKALEAAAQSGGLSPRVLVNPSGLRGIEASEKIELKSGQVKLGGIKMFYDGSIQGYTGYLSQPYHVHPTDPDYKGFSRSSKESLFAQVLTAHQAGRQIMTHANGDQAIEDVLAAYRNAQSVSPRADARHVVIHAQMAREDQLDAMKELNVIPSFFELHTYYWGDRHRDIFLGPDRGLRISPLKSAVARDLMYTVHADTPIVPMDPILMVWAAVNRTSTSGEVIGADQVVSPMEALRANTINGAYQNFEEQERGSIEVGKWADLVVLSANPVKVDPMAIRDIEVVETVLEGKTIYEKSGG